MVMMVGAILFLCILADLSEAYRSQIGISRHSRCVQSTALQAKATGKVASERIRLREDIPKIGKKGEIVFVSSALWQNVLSPGRKALRISDDDMSNINKERDAAVQAAVGLANALVAALKSNEPSLRIKRKAGANGQLFGSITQKILLDEVKSAYPLHVDALSKKEVSLLSIGVDGGTSSVNGEVRKVGCYVAELRLLSNIQTTFSFDVSAE